MPFSFGSLAISVFQSYIAKVWIEDAKNADHTEYECESVNSVLQRAWSVVEDCETKLPSDQQWSVLVVAHGDTLQILQTAFSGIDPRGHRSLDHLETAVAREMEFQPRK